HSFHNFPARLQKAFPAAKSPAGADPACRKSATLLGEPISACCAGQKFFPPNIPLLDKIWRRTAHSPQCGSYAPSAKFPCMYPDRTHMSSGRDFFKSPLSVPVYASALASAKKRKHKPERK